MAQHIQVDTTLTTKPNKAIETTNRPMLFKLSKYAGGDVPKLVQAAITVTYTLDGSNFITEEVGKPLIQGRDWDSATTNPVFTVDVAPVISSFVYSDLPLYKTIIATSGHHNPIKATDLGLVVSYNVAFTDWYNLAGVLTHNIGNTQTSDTFYAFSGYLKDDVILSDNISNCHATNTSLLKAPWVINTALVGASVSEMSFLTNCPSSLVRNIPLGSPLVLGALINQVSGLDVAIDYIDSNSAVITGLEITSNAFSTAATKDIHFSNLSINNDGLFGVTTNALDYTIKSPKFSAYLNHNSSTAGRKLNFNIVERGANSVNGLFGTVHNDSTLIYFINDLNVLDFYLFNGFSNISHENQISSYSTSSKDYTNRSFSNNRVSRASTTEVVTCSTIVNEEASVWLSEIFRSRAVFVYENNAFIPVSVIDGDTTPLSSDRIPTEFELSFIKNTHQINY